MSSGQSSSKREAGGDSPAALDESDLVTIESRAAAASPGPWTSYVEGRDHWGGDDFIQISKNDDEPDMYVMVHAVGPGLTQASLADRDFIAHARQDIPRLVAEVRRLRAERPSSGPEMND